MTGTALYLFVVSTFAYPFSRKDLVFRRFYAALGLISMFFKAGVIPLYFVLRTYGLINNFLVLVLPTAFSFFGVIIFASFFRELPDSLHESARMDGANEHTIFWRLVLPLSKPVFATLALFTAVYNWNDFRMSLIFTNDENLQVIQLVLLRVIASADSARQMASEGAADMNVIAEGETVGVTVQLATMVLTATPILLVYPFLQRYFVKGLLVGSIKG